MLFQLFVWFDKHYVNYMIIAQSLDMKTIPTIIFLLWKKTTDFTEFLNIPGCTKGKCSNVKPEEPEHITGKIGEANNIELPTTQDSNVTQKPRESLESMIRLSRPDFEKATLTRIKPTIARSLLDSAKLLEIQKATSSQEIPIGKVCENGGCKKVSIDFFFYHPCVMDYSRYIE